MRTRTPSAWFKFENLTRTRNVTDLEGATMTTTPPAKKAKAYFGRFQPEWENDKEFQRMITSSASGKEYAYCKACCKSVKVTASGRHDVVRHFQTEAHKRAVIKSKQHVPIDQQFRRRENSGEQCTTEAEVLFCKFLAEHNLPSTTADHFTELVRKMFPDSKAALTFACKRTKATQIVKRCLATELTTPILDQCRNGPFSLLIDESNDKNFEKRLVVLVRIFDHESGTNTRILDLPVLSGGTAAKVFDAVASVIDGNQIPWENLVGFTSDNCNVMMGKHNSVLSRLLEKNPNIVTLGCICHLANLCAKAAVKGMSVPVDDILIDIYYFFEHSSKRRLEYKEFQLFTEVEDRDILKHCPTRWLSLEKVVNRMLQQYPALLSYFSSHPDCEKPGKVKRILQYLEDPMTKLTFFFLKFILPLLNDFNKVFQADESKVGSLVTEMTRLLKMFLSKFVRMRIIKDAGDELTDIDFSDRQNQLPNDIMSVGMDCRQLLGEPSDIPPAAQQKFIDDARAFYCACVKKMLDKFPFSNQLLVDLKVLDVSKREVLDYTAICNLASKFAPDVDQEDLKGEWADFQMMNDDELVLLDKGGRRKKLDIIWREVLTAKTAFGETRFPLLGKLFPALLCLPHSNADSERVFSMVRKIHTEARSTMAPDTLTAFLQVKLNSDSCCHDFAVTGCMMEKAKSCTDDYNKEHQ